jgi:predicted  nucleic acid-binding Zn-ribbon protein
MQLNTPESVALPQEIQGALDHARNNVTVLEAESLRLAKLRMSLETEITAQVAKESELEEKIGELEERYAVMKSEVEGIIKQKKDEMDKVEALQATYESISKKLSDQEAELSAREIAVQMREHGFQVEHMEMRKKMADLDLEKEKIAEKLRKLTEVINS